jgi:hypothetical protein
MGQDKEPAGGQEETARLAAAAIREIQQKGGVAARLTVWDDARPNDVKPGEG